jgi:hypothetical protein
MSVSRKLACRSAPRRCRQSSSTARLVEYMVRGTAAGGQAYELGPGVPGVGDAPDVAVPFQRGHDLGHGLAGDTQDLGQRRRVPARRR